MVLVEGRYLLLLVNDTLLLCYITRSVCDVLENGKIMFVYMKTVVMSCSKQKSIFKPPYSMNLLVWKCPRNKRIDKSKESLTRGGIVFRYIM